MLKYELKSIVMLQLFLGCNLILLGMTFLLLKTHSYLNNVYEGATMTSANEVNNIQHYVQFNSYLRRYSKSYSGDEYFRRLQNYRESLDEIAALNALEGAEVFGETIYADMSKKEFAKMMSFRDTEPESPCINRGASSCGITPRTSNETCGSEVDVKCDWRNKGYVTAVLNQKKCSGCWAFSIVGVMETMAAKNKLGLKNLSVQQLIDCAPSNHCKGGNVGEALHGLCLNNTAITLEENYPLTLTDESCRPVPETKEDIRISSWSVTCEMDEQDMVNWIGHKGPLIVIINGAPLHYYINGIIRRACVRSKNGGGESFNHAVQIVGYDLSGGTPYYIVRNSEGTNFGIDGYVKIAFGDNVCGIQDEVARIDVSID